jgi:alpha-N-acetylglucosamine transferase
MHTDGRTHLFIAVILMSLCLVFIIWETDNWPITPTSIPLSLVSGERFDIPAQRYAFSTHLSYSGKDANKDYQQLTATRALIFQLLRDEKSSSEGIPCLVTVPMNTPKHIQELLTSDGATVLQLNDQSTRMNNVPIEFRSRWVDELNKMKVLELTQFDRIMHLDNSILLSKPVDSLFETENVLTEIHLNSLQMKGDIAHEYPPSGYAFVAAPQDITRFSRYGYKSQFDTKLMIFKPDKQLYRYYSSILARSGSLKPHSLELGLLNYCHRPDGNMPWKVLSSKYWSSVSTEAGRHIYSTNAVIELIRSQWPIKENMENQQKQSRTTSQLND